MFRHSSTPADVAGLPSTTCTSSGTSTMEAVFATGSNIRARLGACGMWAASIVQRSTERRSFGAAIARATHAPAAVPDLVPVTSV